MDHVLQALPWIVGILAITVIKLVRVFTAHQQRMAEILNHTNTNSSDIDSVKREIAELRDLVHDHVIGDAGRVRSSVPPEAPDLSQRLLS